MEKVHRRMKDEIRRKSDIRGIVKFQTEVEWVSLLVGTVDETKEKWLQKH
jgi:hypothetical protein